MTASHRDQRTAIRTRPDRMWLDELPHTASRGERGWQVSWLPGRDDLNEEQARDALVVAKLSNSYRMRESARRDWPRIKELAHGLKVDPRDAVKLVRDAEANAREHANPTPAQQIPHLAAHLPAHPELGDRVILVDAAVPPTVRTPGRAPGQWLASGEYLDRGVER
ncbi:hypothetical protein [Nocardia wallacei]|uniref:hypothetical protein n=1 Tax=Nocardia wallacei TaxID=480035 RepID=UPI0024552305|nr:hypothetical protein [Nocardia wallacei]